MELALYWPLHGYYPTLTNTNRIKDFITSPKTHPLFATMICKQIHEMWEKLNKPENFLVIDYGGGDGTLIKDIINVSEQFEEQFKSSLKFTIIEKLTENSLSDDSIIGCILANELFDAFPVRKFKKHDDLIYESFITIHNSQLEERYSLINNQNLITILEERLGLKENGQIIEFNDGIEPWFLNIAKKLKKGFVLIFDYGYKDKKELLKKWKHGTIVAYKYHRETFDLLTDVGEKDITTFIPFEEVKLAALKTGFKTVGITKQSEFLINLGALNLISQLREMNLPQEILESNILSAMYLLKEEELGQLTVLGFQKNLDVIDLQGFKQRTSNFSNMNIKFPLLKSHHANLKESKYPFNMNLKNYL